MSEKDDGYGPRPPAVYVVGARLELYQLLGKLPDGVRLQNCLATALKMRSDELHEIMGAVQDVVEPEE